MSSRYSWTPFSSASAIFLMLLLSTRPSHGQENKKYLALTNDQSLEILNQVETDLKNFYYDPQMHGINLQEQFAHTRQKIAGAKSQDEALLYITAAVFALNDSHTRFIPPVRPYGVDYGWVDGAVGDTNCYITAVRPDSDAAAKGLQRGDRIVSINGIRITRANLSQIEYSYRVFPQSGLHLDVVGPNGAQRALVPRAKLIPGQEIVRHSDFMAWMSHHHQEGDRTHYFKVSPKILFWKIPDFVVDPHEVDDWLEKIHPFDAVVLDLRGNPGGSFDALKKFVGLFFDHDVKMGDLRARKGTTEVVGRGRGDKAFSGKLIVLVDGNSGSASEIFARTIQLEKRGIVLGDRSRGAVTEANFFPHAIDLSVSTVTTWEMEITIAGLVMSDGRSLEGVGVMPDERILPTADDLFSGRDPVLARASELAGKTITAEKAGKVFSYIWPKEKMPEID